MLTGLSNNDGAIGGLLGFTVFAVIASRVLIGQPIWISLVLVPFVAAAAWAIFRTWTRSTIAATERWSGGKLAVSGVAGWVVVTLVIQLVPIGRDHTNPAAALEYGITASEAQVLPDNHRMFALLRSCGIAAIRGSRPDTYSIDLTT